MNKIAKALLKDETCDTCMFLSYYRAPDGDLLDISCSHKDRIADRPKMNTCKHWRPGMATVWNETKL